MFYYFWVPRDHAKTHAALRDTSKNEPEPKNKAEPLNAKNKTVPTATMKTVPRTTAKSDAVPRMAANDETRSRRTAKSEGVSKTTDMSEALHLHPQWEPRLRPDVTQSDTVMS